MYTQPSYHPTIKKTEILIYERNLGDKNFLEKNKNKSKQNKQTKLLNKVLSKEIKNFLKFTSEKQ